MLQHWHYSEKRGLKNCNQIFRKNTLVMMWELCCEREGRQRRSTEAYSTNHSSKDNETLTKRHSQWGLRGQERFEKCQEVESMAGIVAFSWAETPSRKVTYCRTVNSLTPTAFWKPTVSF